MYPTSNPSSSPQPSRDHTNGTTTTATATATATAAAGAIGLARYRSAPVSFLTTTVDSVANADGNHIVSGAGAGAGNMVAPRFLSPPDTASPPLSSTVERQQTTPFRLNEFATAFNGLKTTAPSPTPSPSPPLFRHGSSPAGFLNTLVSSTPTDGRGSRLSSQISFAAGTSSYSHEETNITNPLVFSSSSSTSHNKRAYNTHDVSGLNIMESEFNFALSESGLEATTMDQIPHDSVPCKIRAKRGCATHPRSIAERERRTRISGKLKKLQDLVPNMDKQTSYSDMLDLAVQHIKGLQTHVQSLKKELENCSCGCKPN